MKTRAIKDIDIAHQIHRLRTAKGMSPTEAHMIYRSLAQNTETYEQVVEVSHIIYIYITINGAN